MLGCSTLRSRARSVKKCCIFLLYFIVAIIGGTGVIAFELKRQYPEMDVTVIEMKNAVKLAEEKFVPGNEHLGVKFITGNV